MWFSPPLEPAIEVFLNMYRRSVVVVMGWGVDDIVKWGLNNGIKEVNFPEQWKTTMGKTMDGAKGFCGHYGVDNHDILIWLEDRPKQASDYGTLWHELHHAVDTISNDLDPNAHFFADDWTSEPRAYLYEYMAVEITKNLWNRE